VNRGRAAFNGETGKPLHSRRVSSPSQAVKPSKSPGPPSPANASGAPCSLSCQTFLRPAFINSVHPPPAQSLFPLPLLISHHHPSPSSLPALCHLLSLRHCYLSFPRHCHLQRVARHGLPRTRRIRRPTLRSMLTADRPFPFGTRN
jgi:hypothetical protein